jgi:hypothetical protein
MRAALTFVLLLAMALAGCAAKTPAPTADATNPTGTMSPAAMGAMPGMAPHWKVGQWWSHHWYFSPQDTTGFMVKAIVVSNGTDGYRLATDEVIDAASHAAFYFHDQGTMGPDWVARDFGGGFQFPWYSFPLSDGKTWTAHEENLDFNLNKLSQDLTLTAHTINGTPGAFSIQAKNADGVRAQYDYQPSIGWFSEYRGFDPKDPDPTHYNVRMVNEGMGQGWTGTYYTAKADFLLNTLVYVSPAGASQEQPPSTFTITAQHTNVMAIPFVFAAAGASQAELVAPDNQHWDAYVVADAMGAPVTQAQPGMVFVPAVPGDWRFETLGGGAFVGGGGCFAWGITMASGTL